MITGINEWKTLTKHISCACKYTFHGIKYNLNQWWNSGECRCKRKKHNICASYYLPHVVPKTENIYHVLWTIQWLYVMKLYSHTMKKAKVFKQVLLKKEANWKMENFYILLAFDYLLYDYWYLLLFTVIS